MNRNCYLCHGVIKYESLPAGDGILCKCVDCGGYEIGEIAKEFIDKNDLTNEIRQDIKSEIKITDNKNRIRLEMSIGKNKQRDLLFHAVPIQRHA